MVKKILHRRHYHVRQLIKMIYDVSTRTVSSLRNDDAEFRNQRTQPIDNCRSLYDKSLANSMECQYRLLVNRFNRDESHVGSRHCFAHRLRIVLAAFAVRSDKLGRDQANGVAKFAEAPRPLM